jgi:hypothetical protein
VPAQPSHFPLDPSINFNPPFFFFLFFFKATPTCGRGNTNGRTTAWRSLISFSLSACGEMKASTKWHCAHQAAIDSKADPSLIMKWHSLRLGLLVLFLRQSESTPLSDALKSGNWGLAEELIQQADEVSKDAMLVEISEATEAVRVGSRTVGSALRHIGNEGASGVRVVSPGTQRS